MSAVEMNSPKKVAKTDAGIKEKFEAMFSSSSNSGAKDGKRGRAHPNFLKLAFAKTGKAYNLGMQQYSKLAPNQRSGALIAAVILLFWPLLGLIMMAPWVLLAVIVAHSVFYGFPDFVQDLEEAILTETRISEKNSKHVKDVSKNLQTNWVNVAVYGKKFAAIGGEYIKVAIDYVYKLVAQAKETAAEKGKAKTGTAPAKKAVEEKQSE